MSDVTTVSDLETNKKHITFCNEVITGKSGGLASGAIIATATNAVTGQVQKTLPKVIDDLGPQYFADWPGVGDPTVTLTNAGQALRYQLADGGDGHDYCWSGSFPKTVSAGSTPTPLGYGGWIDRSDVTLRVELNSDGGTSLVKYYDDLSAEMIFGKLYHAGVIAAKIGATFYNDNVGDDATATQAVIDYVYSLGGGAIFFEERLYKWNSTIILPNPAKRIALRFLGDLAAKVNVNHAGVAIEHRDYFEIHGVYLTQVTGAVGNSRCLSTPTTVQAAHCRYSKVRINGFKTGIWWRYSLWNSVRDVEIYGCKVGVKLSRNALPDDQSNPAAPGSWNQDPGFFHNQNTWDNLLVDGGEIGFWGTPTGNCFTNITFQQQLNATGSANVAAPIGVPGTGLYLQNGSGTSTFGAQGNTIDGLYTEYCRQPIVSEYCRFALGAYYVQGGTSADKYAQVFKITGITLDARGMSASGSDWFTYGIVATDSSIIGSPIGGIALSADVSSASSHILTNTTWNDFAATKATNRTWTPTGASSVTLLAMTDRQSYTVVVGGLYDGSSMRSAQFEVYFHTSGYSRVMSHPSNSTDITCTVSGANLNINVTGSLAYDLRITGIKNRALGQFPVTG